MGGWGGEYVCLRVHVTCRGRASYLVNRLLEVKLLFVERCVCVCVVVGVSVAYGVAGGGSTCVCVFMLHTVGMPRI